MAWMEVEVDLEVLARQFANELGRPALLKFIGDLDTFVAEWDFTSDLRDFFNGIEIPKEDD